MAEFRLQAMAKAKDYQAAVAVLNRVSNVAAAIGGAVVWEAFANEDTGLVVLNETFASEEAFMEYEDAVTSGGLRPLVGEALEFESLILLTPIENERLNQTLDSMGGIRVTPVASK